MSIYPQAQSPYDRGYFPDQITFSILLLHCTPDERLISYRTTPRFGLRSQLVKGRECFEKKSIIQELALKAAYVSPSLSAFSRTLGHW